MTLESLNILVWKRSFKRFATDGRGPPSYFRCRCCCSKFESQSY